MKNPPPFLFFGFAVVLTVASVSVAVVSAKPAYASVSVAVESTKVACACVIVAVASVTVAVAIAKVAYASVTAAYVSAKLSVVSAGIDGSIANVAVGSAAAAVIGAKEISGNRFGASGLFPCFTSFSLRLCVFAGNLISSAKTQRRKGKT